MPGSAWLAHAAHRYLPGDHVTSVMNIGPAGAPELAPHSLQQAAEGIATQATGEPPPGRPASLFQLILGRPLETAAAPHQTIGKAVGMAVFASDALSSVAYATEEILLVLAAAGAIALLLVVLTLSYRQTIFAYPGGGGAYIVARDNLGEGPAQTAGGQTRPACAAERPPMLRGR